MAQETPITPGIPKTPKPADAAKPVIERTKYGKRKKVKTNFKKTSTAIIAEIISLMLSSNETEITDSDIARKYQLSPAGIHAIRKHIPETLKKQLEIKRENRLGELVEDMLAHTLQSLGRISQVTEDEGWLKTQSADKLAILFGVKADRVSKILEAIERANAFRAEREGNQPDSIPAG